MEQKEISKLTTWNNLYKEFCQSIFRMAALVDFIEHCMDPEDKPVILHNPINIDGNLEMGKEKTLPLVTSALTEEKKKTMELARRMKALLDEADFETWNCVVVSPKRRAAVEKWKETLKDEDGGIRATEKEWKEKCERLESVNESINKTLEQCQRTKIEFEQEVFRLKHRGWWARLWNK